MSPSWALSRCIVSASCYEVTNSTDILSSSLSSHGVNNIIDVNTYVSKYVLFQGWYTPITRWCWYSDPEFPTTAVLCTLAETEIPSLLLLVSTSWITNQHVTMWCPPHWRKEAPGCAQTSPTQSGNSKSRTPAHAFKHWKARLATRCWPSCRERQGAGPPAERVHSSVSALFHSGKREAEMLVRYSGTLMRIDKTEGIALLVY